MSTDLNCRILNGFTKALFQPDRSLPTTVIYSVLHFFTLGISQLFDKKISADFANPYFRATYRALI